MRIIVNGIKGLINSIKMARKQFKLAVKINKIVIKVLNLGASGYSLFTTIEPILNKDKKDEKA